MSKLAFVLNNRDCRKCRELEDIFISTDAKFDDCHRRLRRRIRKHFDRMHGERK